MMTKVGGGGKASSGGLAAYLDKETPDLWFSQRQEQLATPEIVAQLDANKRNLGREDDKYYQIVLAPSQAELAHIGSDPQQLQAFTRIAMEQYAQNFGKGIESADLVWFAKIEHGRSYDHTDRAVQLGDQAKGVAKPGDQTHVHVIVSRTENLRQYAEGKASGQHERKNPYHLSPMTNHKATTKGVVTGGFERNGFSQRTEQAFDQTFGYDRALTESFRYLHGMRYGDEPTRQQLQQEATTDAQKRAQSHDQGRRVEMHLQVGKAPEIEPVDDLRAALGQAYRQKDFDELGAALQLAQAERDRQRQVQEKLAEEARKHAQEMNQRTEQQKQPLLPKIEQDHENAPRRGRGLHL
jgi:hypothetical protein